MFYIESELCFKSLLNLYGDPETNRARKYIEVDLTIKNICSDQNVVVLTREGGDGVVHAGQLMWGGRSGQSKQYQSPQIISNHKTKLKKTLASMALIGVH